MLSFLHRWDYCWKCEFDIDVIIVKIENYNHHDGQQLLFYKKVHIKTHSKMKDVLVIFILLLEMKNFNFFLIKAVLKRTSNAIIEHEEGWLEWIVIEQVNYK